MKKLLFLFTVLFAFNVYGDKPDLYIDKVDAVQNCTGDTIITITLTDTTTWKIVVWANHDYLLYNLEKRLTPGLAVEITPNKLSTYYKINGMEVGMTKETKASLPEITSLEKKQIGQIGWWLVYPQYEYSIELSDSSIFSVSDIDYNLRHLDHWKVGDKVFVQSAAKSGVNTGLIPLINTDAPYFFLESDIFSDLDLRLCYATALEQPAPQISAPSEDPVSVDEQEPETVILTENSEV